MTSKTHAEIWHPTSLYRGLPLVQLKEECFAILLHLVSGSIITRIFLLSIFVPSFQLSFIQSLRQSSFEPIIEWANITTTPHYMTVSFKFLFITFALCGLLSHRILFHIPPAPMVYYLASLYSRCIFISFNHRWENHYFFTNHVSKLNFLLFLYSLSYIFSVLLISLSVLYFITIDHHILFHCLFYSAL